MSPLPDSDRSAVATEAADWYARLRAPDVTEIDGLRFRAWLSGPPERRREFEALERLWQGAEHFKHSPAMQRTREIIIARRRKAAGSRRWRMWSLAATVLLTVGMVALFLQQRTSGFVRTDVGELRTIPLSDGSVVTLNTATEVKVHYSETARRIELLKGQASFEVAKDPARPFVVSVGGREVRALGTVFDVYKGKDKVTVTLIEGKVAVTPSASPPSQVPSKSSGSSVPKMAPAPVILNPGEQVSYVPAPTFRSAMAKTLDPIELAAVDVPRVTAWKARKLAFRDTLLPEAIAEANRYSKDQIVLDAPGMESARLSGSFEAGKNELLAEGLRTFFGLRVERQGDNRIVLTQAAE